VDGVGDHRHAPVGGFTVGKETYIVQEGGWALGQVWTAAENLVPTGIQSPDSPARSESLHRVPVLTSSCHRLYYKSFTRTSPEKQSTQWVFKISLANSSIWSENGFITTLTHTQKCKMQFRNWLANRHRQTTWAAAANRRIPPTRPPFRRRTRDSACQRVGRTRRQFDDGGGKVLVQDWPSLTRLSISVS